MASRTEEGSDFNEFFQYVCILCMMKSQKIDFSNFWKFFVKFRNKYLGYLLGRKISTKKRSFEFQI